MRFAHPTYGYHLEVISEIEIVLTFDDGVSFDLSEAQSILEERKRIFNDKPHFVICDLTSNPTGSRAARNYGKSAEVKKMTLGLALITNNSFNRLLGNFMLGLNRGDYPVRMCTSMKEARAWISSQRVVD